jgi:hypothetical protein
MPATPLVAEMPSRLSVEIGTDATKGITLRRDSQSMVIRPPQRVIWTKMVPATSANSVFLLAYEELGDDTYTSASLYRVGLPGLNQPLTSNQVTQVLTRAAMTNMVGDAIIEELYGVSEDGRRLFITLAFREPVNEEWAGYVRRRPYYLYTGDASNKLSEILP